MSKKKRKMIFLYLWLTLFRQCSLTDFILECFAVSWNHRNGTTELINTPASCLPDCLTGTKNSKRAAAQKSRIQQKTTTTSWWPWTLVAMPPMTSQLSSRGGASPWWPWSRPEPRRASRALRPLPAPPSAPQPPPRWASLGGSSCQLTWTCPVSPAPWWMMDSCESTPPWPSSQSQRSARCPSATGRHLNSPSLKTTQKKNALSDEQV